MADPKGSCSTRTGVKNVGRWPLDSSAIKELVQRAGFGWCSELQELVVDKSLLAALLCFFDPETSSFKINDQNYIISLEDVIYLTGLNIDGPPITPKECNPKELCLDLLGVSQPQETGRDIQRPGEVRLQWLRETFMQVDENASEERKQQSARAYILYMIGSCILPASAGGRVSLIYLDLLRDFEQIKCRSWGSAMLALLLHSLCNIRPDKPNPILKGNAILLQLWAYEHFMVIRPSNLLKAEREVPLFKYWSLHCGKKSLNTNDKDKSKKSSPEWVEIIRNMDIESVDLQPYQGLVLSDYLRRQLPLKYSRTVVICVDKYAWLRPDVCPLQCGDVTNVLEDLPPEKTYKQRSGPMPEGFDWYNELSGPVDQWERRWDTLIAVQDHRDSEAPSSADIPLYLFSLEDLPFSWPLDGVLTVDWIQLLMSAFDWSSKNLSPSDFPLVFPVHVLDKLVISACKLLRKEKNVVKVDDCGPESNVIVVGDIHGQLHDFLFLLQDAGYPSENRFFVFNGDYVDRGAWGIETFMLLLAWKVFMPHRVYLLRGNHESKYCTSVYGFQQEVETKYGNEGNHVYRACLDCFKLLPLASIIRGRVFTCHGGLFRGVPVKPTKKPVKRTKKSKGRKKHVNPDSENTTLSLGSLEELDKARRRFSDPPFIGLNLILGDVLWSDPSMSAGLSLNNERGIGLLWGPDCTEDFLKNSNLKLIIRSHEGPEAREKRLGLSGMDEGFTIDHVGESGKLITLFSAPDYPQFQATEERFKNKGAYIVLEPPNFDMPKFHTFEAVTPRPKVDAYYAYEDVIDSDEDLGLANVINCEDEDSDE